VCVCVCVTHMKNVALLVKLVIYEAHLQRREGQNLRHIIQCRRIVASHLGNAINISILLLSFKHRLL